MRSIKNLVAATFILSFLVIIAGAVVRTTQSGMGCPDWPRCFGKWIPPTNAAELPPDFEKYLRKQDIDHSFNVWHTWIEYFNRLLGMLLGIFAIMQAIVLFRKRSELRSAFRLSMLFLFTVVLTGLFGALVVKLNLAHLSISVHLLFAIILIQIQLALLLSVQSKFSKLCINDRMKKAVGIFIVLVLIQSALGTMVRMYVDDVSKLLHYEQRETWLAKAPTAFYIHRAFSCVVLFTALAMAWYGRKNYGLKNKLFWLAAMVLLNMIAGIILYYANVPAIAQPIHLLLATIVITQSFSVFLQAGKSTAIRSAENRYRQT